MNAIDFYERCIAAFGRERLNVWYYVNPTLNHKDFPDVQFLWPFGGSVPPINPKATELWIADPLNGPFYRLEVVGAEFVEAASAGDPHTVCAIVRLPDGRLSHTCSIFVASDPAEVKREVGRMVGEEWYSIDPFATPEAIVKL